MTHRPLLVAAMILGGCVYEDPHDTDDAREECPTWYADLDGDGYGNRTANPVVDCRQPPNHVDNNLDCHDGDAAISPDAIEVCDEYGLDEDCDGLVDNDDPDFTGGTVEFWPDRDGDGFGDATGEPKLWCSNPGAGWSETSTDCDDDDVTTYPGAAWLDSDHACMRDADNDGYGDMFPPPGFTPGSDCDDDDFFVHPEAVDDAIDGLDPNCDGLDGPPIADDFESGSIDPSIWPFTSGNPGVQAAPGANGAGVLRLSMDDIVESAALDTSACSSVLWSYQGSQATANPPDSTDYLYFEYFDGASWVRVDTWPGPDGAGVWATRQGVIDAPGALHAAFQARFVADTSMADEHFYVDDVVIGCAMDNDGDGAPDPLDCAPADPNHWSDCGKCVDVDGDFYGKHCDFGSDCDDDDPLVNPLAPDPYGDGVDSDCSGHDGVGLVEDFEGAWFDTTWIRTPGVDDHVYASNVHVVSGTTSLRIQADGAVTRVPYDLGPCTAIVWEFQGKRGPDTPEAGDELFFEVNTARGWIVADAWDGGLTDPSFVKRQGYAGAPDLDGTQLELRFRGDGIVGDDWFVDDLRVHCAADADADGSPDALDCDVADPWHWADCGSCVDADNDGYGLDCDLGPDCDDADPGVNPGAPDATVDGDDQDCDTFDGGPTLYDDFENGGPDPAVWASATGNVASTTTYVGQGAHAMDVYGSGGVLETHTTDLSSCPAVAWSYLGMNGGAGAADAGDFLHLEWWDGAAWVLADTWEGGSVDLDLWKTRRGIISDPAAASPDFKLRFRGQSTVTSDHFYIDVVEVGCTAADNDGDGLPKGFDCDDGDPMHWADCGLCVDADGDGYGRDCDFGPDCDDADPGVNPSAFDAGVDGTDQDCDLFDGAATLYDDFENGGPDPAVWASVTGNVASTTTYVGQGARSMDVYGSGGVLETHATDLSPCPSVAWSYEGMTGGAGAADAGDYLYVEWWDGAAWVLADVWEGGAVDLNVWKTRRGIISDPAAASASFKLRFRGQSTVTSDHFYIDVVQVGCTAADNDGDGVPKGLDCDDGDWMHWADCGLCVDGDGDGYGRDCDLGPDCDDADPAIHPGALDATADGRDQDCDLFDGGAALYDDFENGGPDPAVWSSVTGNVASTTTYVGQGARSMDVYGSGGILESRSFDLSACPAVAWSYLGMNGGAGAADAGDYLYLEWWDGASWVLADTWEGGAVDLNLWQTRKGIIVHPAAASPGFQLRLRGQSTVTSDHFYVDVVQAGCTAADNDGDGYPGGLDCDDNDGAHWADCGACVDLDGDDHGEGCDLGPDCDDLDPALNPGAPDLTLDGIDQDCNTVDGPVLVADDFEPNGPDPATWETVSGNIATTTTWVHTGNHAMDIYGPDGVMESFGADSSVCANGVAWRFVWMNGGAGAADVGDWLHVEYWDGASWLPIVSIEGGVGDDVWRMMGNVLTDPGAMHADFKVRFRGDSTITSDHFYVDDVVVSCAGPDADGDGYPAGLDCDDTDFWHWFDCGLCVDVDGDGFGQDCDLGEDCDDLDPMIAPPMPDVYDGVDSDCDGLDVAMLADDFESGGGGPDPMVWSAWGGTVATTSDYVWSGATAMDFFHNAGTMESVAFDPTACTTIGFSYKRMNGGAGAADAGDYLHLEYWDGASWVRADTWEGGPAFPWEHHQGEITDPAAYHPGFKVRFDVVATVSTDHFYVDDFAIGCFD